MGFYWRMLLQPSDKYGAPRVEAARLRVSLTHIPTVMQPSDVRSDLAARILPDRNVRPIYMSPCPPFSMTCDFEVEHLGIGISSHWTYSSHIKSLTLLLDRQNDSMDFGCRADGACPVAPHPNLLAKLKAEKAKVKGTAEESSFRRKQHVLGQGPRTGAIIGLNDGLIFPRSHFDKKTSLNTMRRAALDRTPLRGIIKWASSIDIRARPSSAHNAQRGPGSRRVYRCQDGTRCQGEI